LTPDEQYTHISLWCLLSAPLLIGCPIEEIDAFTMSLLTNDEVLDVDQDPLGIAGSAREKDRRDTGLGQRAGRWFACRRIFQYEYGDVENSAEIDWASIGPETRCAKCRVRDLWRQQDVGTVCGSLYRTERLRPHGCAAGEIVCRVDY
jgi:alpha-galactosidase